MSSNTAIIAITTVLLFFKIVAVAMVQGIARLRAGKFTRAEDAEQWKGELVSNDVPLADRAQRTLRNDMENIPIFLLLVWAWAVVGASTILLSTVCAVFVVARVTHTLTYLRPRQPLRNRAYVSGLVACLVACGGIGWALLLGL